MPFSDAEGEIPGPHHLEVYVLGGTIACGEESVLGVDGNAIIKKIPQPGKIRHLIDHHVDPRTRERFDRIVYSEADQLRDSNQLKVHHLDAIVRDVRERLEKNHMSMVICTGTDNAAAVTHVLAEGIPASVLGDRSIVVVVSKDHAPSSPDIDAFSEPVYNLTNAMYLTMRQELVGRIQLCCHSRLYPPRGLRKVDTGSTDPFLCRFGRVGVADRSPVPRWQIYDQQGVYTGVPRGPEEGLILSTGIEVKDLGITSEYRNLPHAVDGMVPKSWRRNRNTHPFNGLILMAPGEGSVRESKTDLAHLNNAAEIAAKYGIPTVLVGDPQQPENDVQERGEVYAGAMAVVQKMLNRVSGGESPLIDGGKLTVTEARLLVSASVAQARSRGMDAEGIIAHTRLFLAEYDRFLHEGPLEKSMVLS